MQLPEYHTPVGVRGLRARDSDVNHAPWLVRSEFEIMGSRTTTKQEMQETVNLVDQGRIRPIVDQVFSLEDME